MMPRISDKTELMNKRKERIRAAEKIHEKARYLRGRFLNSVAVIERDIALILTDYFCTVDEEKRKLFFKRIATGHFFSLKVKKDVLFEIVRSDYPRYWTENKAELKYLDKIIEFRNKLAHSIVDVSDEALSRPLEQGIGFVEWNTGRPVTDGEFEDWDLKTASVLECLSGIRMLLPFKEKRD